MWRLLRRGGAAGGWRGWGGEGGGGGARPATPRAMAAGCAGVRTALWSRAAGLASAGSSSHPPPALRPTPRHRRKTVLRAPPSFPARPTPPHPTTSPPPYAIGQRGGGVPRGQGVSGWLWPARLPSRRAPAHPLGGAPPPSRRGWRGQLSHLPGLCAAQAVFCSHPMQLCALQHSCERCWWPWSRRRRRLRRRRRCPPVAEVAPCAPPPLPFPGGRIPISPFRCCLRRFSEGGSHRGSA